jgi:hypothetical protein
LFHARLLSKGFFVVEKLDPDLEFNYICSQLKKMSYDLKYLKISLEKQTEGKIFKGKELDKHAERLLKIAFKLKNLVAETLANEKLAKETYNSKQILDRYGD